MMTMKAHLNSHGHKEAGVAAVISGRLEEWVIYPKKTEMHLF